jgi:plasmid stabilization system protein ParE
MILLPRGYPVKENIDPGQSRLPEALERLRRGRFTGCLHFDFAAGAGALLFQTGRLSDALCEAAGQHLVDADALTRIFERSHGDKGRLGIYRFTPEAAAGIHALLHGEVLQRSQYLRLIDVPALLAQLRTERRTCCLRVYARDHVALIFYRDGQPLGFLPDGALDIETAVDLSRSVARDPGAKIEVVATGDPADEAAADLLATVDVTGLWEQVVARHQGAEEAATLGRGGVQLEGERRQQARALFLIAAREHLGRVGVALVEQEFDKLAGVPLGEAQLAAFFNNLAKAAERLAGPDRIGPMLAEMKSEARVLLRGG